jgi:uncharacterized protein (TIGR02145 family)
MKIIKNFTIQLIWFLAILIAGCKKEDKPKLPVIDPPAITTTDITNNLGISATGGGTITSDGGSAVTARGICWSKVDKPTIADSKTTDSIGTGSFISQLTNLSSNTTYYVRAYATNTAGTTYGNSVQFTTNTVDLDGNLYHSITIGAQVWMVENLKVTHYRNGDPVPNVTDNTQWESLNQGAYCDYNNDPGNTAVYGHLYNSYATSDQRNICPEGWRLPTNADWLQLEVFLGGNNVAGGKMKEAGTTHWTTPNTSADNSSGFTGVPGGNRGYGGFADLGNYAYFWSDPTSTYSRGLLYNMSATTGISNYSTVLGLSIRCIKE